MDRPETLTTENNNFQTAVIKCDTRYVLKKTSRRLDRSPEESIRTGIGRARSLRHEGTRRTTLNKVRNSNNVSKNSATKICPLLLERIAL